MVRLGDRATRRVREAPLLRDRGHGSIRRAGRPRRRASVKPGRTLGDGGLVNVERVQKGNDAAGLLGIKDGLDAGGVPPPPSFVPPLAPHSSLLFFIPRYTTATLMSPTAPRQDTGPADKPDGLTQARSFVAQLRGMEPTVEDDDKAHIGWVEDMAIALVRRSSLFACNTDATVFAGERLGSGRRARRNRTARGPGVHRAPDSAVFAFQRLARLGKPRHHRRVRTREGGGQSCQGRRSRRTRSQDSRKQRATRGFPRGEEAGARGEEAGTRDRCLDYSCGDGTHLPRAYPPSSATGHVNLHNARHGRRRREVQA